MKKLIFCFSLFIYCLLSLNSHHSANASETYTFGIVPQFEQRKLYSRWKPIIEELEKRTGLTFRIATALTIPEFEKEFAKGNFDFAYMNPYHLLKANKAQGYIPILRCSDPIKGILVVKKDSQIKELSELNGKTIAFPSPNALGASLLMRADLERLYNVKFSPLYVKTHSSVYIHAATGLTDAGGGIDKTLQEQEQTVRDALRILYTTRPMPSHPISTHPRVPREHANKVQRAMIEMNNTKEGNELLSKIPINEPIPTTFEDYKHMLGWGLDAYWKKD